MAIVLSFKRWWVGMLTNIFKKAPPFIILLDIMTLLMFMYMSMPHEKDTIKLKINYSDGIIDGTVLEARDNLNNVAYKKVIRYGQLSDIANETQSFFFKSVACKKNSTCAKVLNLDFSSGKYKYFLFFPDEKIKIALALRYSFCNDYNCDGNIYLNAATGISFICSDDGKSKYLDEVQREISDYYESCIYQKR